MPAVPYRGFRRAGSRDRPAAGSRGSLDAGWLPALPQWGRVRSPSGHRASEEASGRGELSSCSGLAVPLHRLVHLCSPVERSEGRALLYFLPGLFHPVVVPLQRKARYLRLGNLLVGDRSASARSGTASSLRLGFSWAKCIQAAHHSKAAGSLCPAPCTAPDPCEHGAECSRIRALAWRVPFAGQVGVWLPCGVLHLGGHCLL